MVDLRPWFNASACFSFFLAAFTSAEAWVGTAFGNSTGGGGGGGGAGLLLPKHISIS